MEGWIQFGRGPLFRFSFALMLLGLLRLLVLTGANLGDVYRNTGDRRLPWKDMARQTLAWLFPLGRLWRRRPFYSTLSFIFHAGMIVTPLFLAVHVLLWNEAVGFAWPAIPQRLANVLTLTVIATAVGLFLGRVLPSGVRRISRLQDFVWPVLLAVPFITGYVASNLRVSPATYQLTLLTHVYAGDLIMLMIPFTKIAHCVLAPLSQLVTQAAWKFAPGAGDRVAETLGYADRPNWLAKARLSGPAASSESGK